MLTLLSGVISTLDEGLKQIQQAFAWASATRRWCQTFCSAAMVLAGGREIQGCVTWGSLSSGRSAK